MTSPDRPRLLLVCLGNICRSPAAEGVLAAMSGGRLSLDSAGTAGWHTGKPPHPPMVRAAARRGYDLSGLRARQLVPADFEAFDLVLAMDRQNLRDIRAMRPEGARARTGLFLDALAEPGTDEVPDPYFTGDYDGALQLIERGARALLSRLGAGPQPR